MPTLMRRPTIADLLDDAATLIESGTVNREFALQLRMTAKLQRKYYVHRGIAARGKGGRKPRPLPWELIDPMRARKLPWPEIARRLETEHGFRVHWETLRDRWGKRLQRQITVSVTRG